MFCFDEKGPEVAAGEEFFDEEKDYYEIYERHRINVFHQPNMQSIQQISINNLDLDFLDKMSIFLKVSSGTYNLSRTPEADSYI